MALIIENQDTYFKVIEEQLQENKLVTFKWLSRKLKIHCSIVKNLLDAFVAKSTNKKYIVTYLVFGKTTEGGLTIILSKKNDVSSFNGCITSVSKHVYCIESEPNIFNAQHIYDNDKLTYELNQMSLSSFNYPSKIIAKVVSSESQKKNVVNETNEVKSNSACKSMQNMSSIKFKEDGEKAKKIKNVKSNNTTKGSLTYMFDNQRIKNSTAENTKQTTNNACNVHETLENTETTKLKPIKGGLSQLFEAQRLKKANKKSTSVECNSNDESTRNDSIKEIAIEKNERNASKRTIKQDNSSLKSSKSNKSRIKKKMKRIVTILNSSSEEPSSEEENMHMEKEFECELKSEPDCTIDETLDSAHVTVYGKKRKRKVVEKTVYDEEGYLHTSKEFVYESCESDEEDEDNKNLNIDNKRLKVNDFAEIKELNIKTENNIVLAKNKAEIQPLKTKQVSITNFFKRP